MSRYSRQSSYWIPGAGIIVHLQLVKSDFREFNDWAAGVLLMAWMYSPQLWRPARKISYRSVSGVIESIFSAAWKLSIWDKLYGLNSQSMSSISSSWVLFSPKHMNECLYSSIISRWIESRLKGRWWKSGAQVARRHSLHPSSLSVPVEWQD